MHPRRSLVAVGLLVAVLAAPVAAQTFVSPSELTFDPGTNQVQRETISLRNPVERTVFGQARMAEDVDQGFSVQPREFTMGPNETETLEVRADGADLGVGRHTNVVEITIVDQGTAATERHRVNVTATVEAPPLVFDRWENPLPEPAAGAAGVFALEMATWLGLAWIAMRVNDAAVVRGMPWIPRRVRNRILDRIDGPLFVTLVATGINYTWRLLPQRGFIGLVGSLLKAVLALSIAFLAYRIIDGMLVYYGQRSRPRTETGWDEVAVPVLRKVLLAGIGAFGLFYVLQTVGVDLGWLVAGGVVVGLVLSNSLGPTLANLFSGLFILMDRPFREGDDIRLSTGEVCHVRRIGLRSTRLYYYRNHEMIIAPNNELENARVVNLAYPDPRYRLHMDVSIAYGSPLGQVREIMIEEAREHPQILDGEGSEPMVFLEEFGDNGLQFRLAVYINDVAERFRIMSELRNRIDGAFRDADITIPFPQRTIWEADPDEPVEPLDEDPDA
jgi:small-conductance mechanosensitive channel